MVNIIGLLTIIYSGFTLSPISPPPLNLTTTKISYQEQIESIFFKGIDAQSNAQFDLAIKYYNEYIKRGGKSNLNATYGNIGTILLAQHKPQEAIENFNKAIQLDTNDGSSYARRGVAYEQIGNKKLALLDYNKSINIEPNNFEFLEYRAGYFFDSHNYQESITDYSKLVVLAPQNPEYPKRLAQIYYETKQPDKAFTYLTQALALKPNYAEALMYRGLIYRLRNANEQALQDFNQTIQLNPKYAAAYAYRGALLMQKGQIKEGKQDLEQALLLNPKLVFALLERGKFWLNQASPQAAIADLNQAIQLEPRLLEAYFWRAEAWLANEDYPLAMQDFGHLLKVNPNDVNAALGVTYCQLMIHHDQLAIQYANQLEGKLTEPVQKARLAFIFARYHKRQNRLDFAKRYAQEAIKLAPYMGLYHFEVGDIMRLSKANKIVYTPQYQKACQLGYKWGCLALEGKF